MTTINMGSSNNSWIEPIGYTSSFRPVRTPLRLNYGRDDPKIKETRGQKFRKQNKGRESIPRTFPMELRSWKEIIPEVGSSKKPKYSRSRSSPREGSWKEIIPEVGSSKKPKYSRSRSSPREGSWKEIIPEVGSSKKPKYSRSRSSPREVLKSNSDVRRSPRINLPRFSEPLWNTDRNSKLLVKETRNSLPKGKNTPKRAPPGYIHSRLSTPNRIPYGYTHASSSSPNRAPSGHRYSSPRYRQETDQYAPRGKPALKASPLKKDSKSAGLKHKWRPGKRNSSPTSFNSKYYRNNDEDTPRRFLRSHSEPPRRSARIANLLKKSDTHQGVKNEERNSAIPRARSRAVRRAKDTSHRDSRFNSKYKTSPIDYRSSSVAPSRYSSGNNFISSSRELHNRVTKKEKRYPHRSSTSHGQRSIVPPNGRNNEPREYDQSTSFSVPAMFCGSPSATAERFSEDPNISIEDTEPSYQEDVENDVVDIVNRVEDAYSDYSRQLDEYQEETNEYCINNDPLFSRREPSNYVNDTNANRNNGLAHYEASSWQAAYNDHLSPTEYAHYQVSSWQAAYNERLLMQNNFWNNNVFASTQILCPDGGVLCVNENIYCLNSRVSLNNEYGT